MRTRIDPFARLLRGGAMAALILSPSAALAQTAPQQVLSATACISVTIQPSATVGRDSAARGAPWSIRGEGGRELGASDVQVVFADRRGERVVRDVRDIARAVAAARRAGDDSVEVTFVF